MISLERFMGLGIDTTIAGTNSLNFRWAKLQVIRSSSPQDLILPDARRYQPGGPHGYIINRGSADFSIKDRDGTLVATLSPGYAFEVFLIDNTHAYGIWQFKESIFQGG